MRLFKILVNDQDYYKPTYEEVLNKIQKCLRSNNYACKSAVTEGNGSVMFSIFPMTEMDMHEVAKALNNLLADRRIRTDGFKVMPNNSLRCLVSKDCFRL